MSIDSWRAASMNAQVLTTTRSAPSASCGGHETVGEEARHDLVGVDRVLRTPQRLDPEGLRTHRRTGYRRVPRIPVAPGSAVPQGSPSLRRVSTRRAEVVRAERLVAGRRGVVPAGRRADRAGRRRAAPVSWSRSRSGGATAPIGARSCASSSRRPTESRPAARTSPTAAAGVTSPTLGHARPGGRQGRAGDRLAPAPRAMARAGRARGTGARSVGVPHHAAARGDRTGAPGSGGRRATTWSSSPTAWSRTRGSTS